MSLAGSYGLRVGHRRLEVVVDEQPPDVLVRVVADEILDVDAAVAELAPVAVGLGDLGLDRHNAFEPGFELAHRLPFLSTRAVGCRRDGT